MSSIYIIPAQGTYKGRTAGGYIKTAKVVRNQAGFGFVVSDLLPGAEMILTESGDLVINNFDGAAVRMPTSDRAEAQLRRLIAKADAL